MLYRARWLYSGDGPPLENGTIEITNGVITRILPHGDCDVDLGAVAILPGLINAHTHLEFSSRKQPLAPLHDFPNWIRSVIQYRQKNPDCSAAAVRSGLLESSQAGVTTIGEIATTDWRDGLQDSPAQRMLIFREYLGLADSAVSTQLASAREFLNQASHSDIGCGLSPHAPYSLHPDLFAGLCQLAAEFQVPMAMHLAESPAEIELLKSGRGPLAEMLTTLGVFQPQHFSTPQRPLDFLKRLDQSGLPVLVVHGNELDQAELAFLATRPHFTVVYCPRTHAAMQSQSHPWKKMLELGINVALGTDSRASNPDLSLWNELRFLWQHNRGYAASELLRLATVNAAQGLGIRESGSLAPGKVADLCLISLKEASLVNPEKMLFELPHAPSGTMVAGQWIVPPRGLASSVQN